MYQNHRVVCVTPAGRRRYMELLVPYVLRSSLVDEYHIWANTTDSADLAFFREVRARDSRVAIVEPPQYPVAGNQSIGQFFRHCIDPQTIYIRFDDDIVWLSARFFETLLTFRLERPGYFIVSPLIINNALCSYLLQAKDRLRSDYGPVQPLCMDRTGWGNPKFAHHLHNLLLHAIAIDDVEALVFDDQPVALCRFSINCICWFGREFGKFAGQVPYGADEEEWISATKPAMLGQANGICGRAIASHFAFVSQRAYLDGTDLLARYRALAASGSAVAPPPERPGNRSLPLAPLRAGYPELRARFEALVRRGCVWEYSRSDGLTICPAVTLLPDGSIAGYRHFNESRWELRKGWICFVDGSGRTSTRFHRLEVGPDGRLRAGGIYLFNAVDFHHVLTQRDAAA